MYRLAVEKKFAAAHQLRGYEGKCENLHGHNFKVKVTVCGEQLNKIGLLIDFKQLKNFLNECLDLLDHKNLNDLKNFSKTNPSSENIAKFIAQKMNEQLNCPDFANVKLESVTVWESDNSSCEYFI